MKRQLERQLLLLYYEGDTVLQQLFILAISGIILFQNCAPAEFHKNNADKPLNDLEDEDGDPIDPDSPICDPLNPGHTADKNGLKGQMFYLRKGIHGDTKTELNSRTLDYYFKSGLSVSNPIYMSDLSLPTTWYESGFKTEGGQVLTIANEKLVEYFALKLHARIKLDATDSAGLYQFAILSDDGAKLKIETTSGLETIVNNDGTHSTKMGCASKAVDLQTATRLISQVEYYQGPRTETALQLLWRKVAANTNLNYSLCGVSGQKSFFDQWQNGGTAVPTSNYKKLMADGWKVLKNGNYLLPGDQDINPCD